MQVQQHEWCSLAQWLMLIKLASCYSDVMYIKVMMPLKVAAPPCRCVQVREALMTSALLVLPCSMPRSEKDARVESVLDMLVSWRPAGTPAALHAVPGTLQALRVLPGAVHQLPATHSVLLASLYPGGRTGWWSTEWHMVLAYNLQVPAAAASVLDSTRCSHQPHTSCRHAQLPALPA
jgi:hypothetical protein